MKRKVYISLFVVLGFLSQFVVHALLEMGYIALLNRDFEKWGFGLPFSAWVLIHHVGTAVLLIAGLAFGLYQGRYWWERIYGSRS